MTLIINLVSSQFNFFLWTKIIWNIMLKFNNCTTIKDIYIYYYNMNYNMNIIHWLYYPLNKKVFFNACMKFLIYYY